MSITYPYGVEVPPTRRQMFQSLVDVEEKIAEAQSTMSNLAEVLADHRAERARLMAALRMIDDEVGDVDLGDQRTG